MIFHRDRGSHDASATHRTELAAHGMLASMSGRGKCYDNAVAESFLATLLGYVSPAEYDAPLLKAA